MNATQLAQSVFKAIDAMKPEEFGEYLTGDCRFAFGNWPSAEGRAATIGTVANFFSGINGISHEIQQVWESGDTVIVKLGVTYHRKDGKVITLPCANIWKMDRDRISDYQIYMDVNPVLA